MVEASRTKWEKYTKINVFYPLPGDPPIIICRRGSRWPFGGSRSCSYAETASYIYQPFASYAVGGRSGELLHA